MFLETAHDDGVVRIASAGARIDDNVHRGQFMLMLTKRFPDQAFDAVTPHGVADSAGGNRQSKSWNRTAAVTSEDREAGVGGTARVPVDAIEFGFMPETLRRLERPDRGWQVESRTNASAAKACALDRQTLATLGATAGEHLTARTGGHAGTEAVGALTVNFARLVSTLHAGISTMSKRLLGPEFALKQVHAGARRGAARLRTTPRSVKLDSAPRSTKFAAFACG